MKSFKAKFGFNSSERPAGGGGGGGIYRTARQSLCESFHVYRTCYVD